MARAVPASPPSELDRAPRVLPAAARLVTVGAIVTAATIAQPALAASPERATPFAAGVECGEIADGGISEASGIAATRTLPGLLWIHNDSGDSARVYAVSPAGATVATYDLSDLHAIDYEDVAVGPGPARGVNYLYLADIGDNFANRPFVVVHRLPEPDAANERNDVDAADVAVLELAYPDGSHDAEALMVDPLSGDVFVIVKSVHGRNGVYRAPFPQSDRSRNSLERVATIVFPGESASDIAVTAADISPAGDEILIRTYNKAGLWQRAAGESVAAALAREPVPADVPGPPVEPQGQAIGFSSDGRSYFTIGEGIAQPLYRFDRADPR